MQNIYPKLFFLISFLKLSAYTATAQAPVNLPPAYPQTLPPNVVRSYQVVAPVTNAADVPSRTLKDVRLTSQYLDGLGRPLQTVIKQGSLVTPNQTGTDLVSPVVYDAMGRETYKYLPFASGNTTGALVSDPFQQQAAFYNTRLSGETGETNLGPNNLNWAYGKTNYEASPLGRVQSVYAPGSSWVGSEGNANRNMSTKYWFNTATDEVRMWTVTEAPGTLGNYSSAAAYPAGELYKNVVVDEHGKQVIEFKDKSDLLILKKVQVGSTADNGAGTGHNDWLCTYFIYDDFSRLRAVIQPAGVEALNGNGWLFNTALLKDQCFRYVYDELGRVTQKQVPGVAVEYMLYDLRSRLVLTQDGNLRNSGKWLFTGYDDLDRPVLTGIYSTTQTRDQMAAQLSTGTNFTGSSVVGQKAYSFPTFIDISNVEVLSRIFYDNYEWASLYASHSANYGTFDNSDASKFLAVSNASWPYPQALTQSLKTEGLVTGNWDKTANGLVSSLIYDEKGRVIQTKSRNQTGGNDLLTTQYSFSGQPLRKLLVQRKAGAPVQTHKVLNNFDYDNLGRILTVKNTVESVINGVAVNTPEVTIVQNEYDALGQLKSRKLGQQQDEAGAYSASPVETLNYTYNVRGWLLGVNRTEMLTGNGQSSDHYFGFELGYDKQNNTAARNFTGAQFNGNISGILWKSTTDGIRRKYDFRYDAANRLLKGDFEQHDENSSWGNSTINFSMKMGDGILPNSAYDANGNIKAMQQFGLTANGAQIIDDLTYTYLPGTNKLQKVYDGAAIYPGLGDFNDKNATTDDYGYDENGNLITDKNKGLKGATGEGLTSGGAIIYNHLNLPVHITVKDENDNLKGYISFLYDNTGNKLKKTVEDKTVSGKTITTTTTYLGGMVYVSKTTVPADPNNPDYTDQLQFIAHEEGRIRFIPAIDNTPANFSYDYFIKDHLGNVRMVLTSQEQQDVYPIASLEQSASDLSTSKLYYQIDESKLTNRSQIDNLPGFQNNNGIETQQDAATSSKNSQVLYKLMATGGKAATGLGITLKVTGGDKVSLFGKSFYNEPNAENKNFPVPVLSLLENLPGGAVAAGKVAMSSGLSGLTGMGSALTGFLNKPGRNNANTKVPRAALNWILFDEQLKVVNEGVGFKKVSKSGALEELSQMNIEMPKSGYLYVYASNESAVPVYFDNIQVVHNRGRVLEETHYYPFGLTMAGISNMSAGGMENKNRYNGKEIQNNEFADNSGLELYDYGARMYDAQVGRWQQIDPLADQYRRWSPFNFSVNNPLRFIDPDGMGVNSVHVDDYGTVLQNIDDGDNSVYMHTGKNAADVALDYIFTEGTSAGGKKIGELGGVIEVDGIYTNLLNKNLNEAANIWSPWTFKALVTDGGDWDLKVQKGTIWGLANDGKTKFKFEGKEMESQDIGNHHFGAVAKASLGYILSEKEILMEAGNNQIKNGRSDPKWQPTKTITETRIIEHGMRVTETTTYRLWPYGDDPRDSRWIEEGFNYYKRGREFKWRLR